MNNRSSLNSDGSEDNTAIIHRHFVFVTVQDQPPDLEPVGPVPRRDTRSSQHGFDSGDEFSRAERFYHVVIGADCKPQDPVEFLASCREHQDRDVREFTYFAAHLPAVEQGEHQIENDERGVLLPDQLQGFDTVHGNGALVSFALKIKADERGGFIVILNNENGSWFCHESHLQAFSLSVADFKGIL